MVIIFVKFKNSPSLTEGFKIITVIVANEDYPNCFLFIYCVDEPVCFCFFILTLCVKYFTIHIFPLVFMII